MDYELLERQLAELPLAQYAFIDPRELTFTERIRYVCQQECPRYGTSWACPPAVGSVEECRARCLAYPHALLLTTVTEVEDITDLQETLDTREPHEQIVRRAARLLREQAEDVYVLSTESCAVCEHCSYPQGPCRHPEKMFPCVESHGIVATDIAEKCGIEFYDGNLVTWFSILFFR